MILILECSILIAIIILISFFIFDYCWGVSVVEIVPTIIVVITITVASGVHMIHIDAVMDEYNGTRNRVLYDPYKEIYHAQEYTYWSFSSRKSYDSLEDALGHWDRSKIENDGFVIYKVPVK